MAPLNKAYRAPKKVKAKNRIVLQLKDTFCQELVPCDFPVIVLQIENFLPLVVHAQRQCLNLNEEKSISSSRARLISTFWHAKMSLTIEELIQNVLHSKLHNTENLPNMKV